MLQNDPWAAFPLANQAPSRPALPRVIEGPPRQPPPQTPAAAQGDVLRNTRTQQEIDEAAREAARLAADPAGDAGADQRRSAGFYSRALNSSAHYDRLNIGPRSYVDDVAAGVAPRIQNYRDDPARRQAERYMRDFIGATLRYESGAAIPPEEFENQRRIYFPSPGDDPATIRALRQLRQQAIDSLRIGAGPAAATVPPVLGVEDIRASIERAEPEDGGTINYQVSTVINGRPVTMDVPGPPGLTPEQATQLADRYVRETYPNQPFERATYRDPQAPEPTGGPWNDLGVGVGDVVQGAGDVLGLVANPANAAMNWATGSNATTDFGQYLRDLSGLPSPQGGQQELVSMLLRGGTGALTLAGGARTGANLATGALRGAMERFGSTPLVDAAAGASAGGAADATRQAGYGPAVQTGAALLGGGMGAMGAQRMGRAIAPGPVPSHPLVRAGQEEGVTVNRAMVDRDVQSRVTGVEGTVGGGRIVGGRMRRVGSQIEDRVGRLGQGGTALDDNNAGQTVERAARRHIAQSGQRANRMYDAAEAASDGVRVQPQQSLALIDETLTRLRETPETNGAEIQFMERLRADFSRDLSVPALRRIRTQLRGRIRNGGLTFGEDEASVLGIMDAASQDIEAGLRAAGRDNAAGLFRRADDFYRDRMSFISGTVQRLIGRRDANLPPGQVFANFRSMAAPRGDNAGLARMMREMEPEEQADIAATFAQSLGRNNRGEFSTAHLVSQAERLPRAARVNLFGQQGARSLDNLIALAREHSRVVGGLNNSRTGQANDWRSILLAPILGGGGAAGVMGMASGGLTSAALAGAAAAGAVRGAQTARNVISARALMSPNITQWLRQAPRTNAIGPIRRHVARLSSIAAREPALADEIQQFQQMMMQALNDNVSQVLPSAAQDESER